MYNTAGPAGTKWSGGILFSPSWLTSVSRTQSTQHSSSLLTTWLTPHSFMLARQAGEIVYSGVVCEVSDVRVWHHWHHWHMIVFCVNILNYLLVGAARWLITDVRSVIVTARSAVTPMSRSPLSLLMINSSFCISKPPTPREKIWRGSSMFGDHNDILISAF